MTPKVALPARLTSLERMSLQGVFARKVPIDKASQELENDITEVLEQIELRLQLNPGSIRTKNPLVPPTHTLDLDTWEVSELEMPPRDEEVSELEMPFRDDADSELEIPPINDTE